tara:strand:- start:11613 stop:12203 length:591 start_codon:yes stop_codon:yes gene_type:complete
MSFLRKNGTLQEEVAPVTQEYTGQHPLLKFKVTAIIKPDHLDQYMEVHPFASSEGELNINGDNGFEKTYGFQRAEQNAEALKTLVFDNGLSGLFYSGVPPRRRSRNSKGIVANRLWYFVPVINKDTTKEDMQNIHEKMELIVDDNDDDYQDFLKYLKANSETFDWEKGTMLKIVQYEGYSLKGIFNPRLNLMEQIS